MLLYLNDDKQERRRFERISHQESNNRRVNTGGIKLDSRQQKKNSAEKENLSNVDMKTKKHKNIDDESLIHHRIKSTSP